MNSFFCVNSYFFVDARSVKGVWLSAVHWERGQLTRLIFRFSAYWYTCWLHYFFRGHWGRCFGWVVRFGCRTSVALLPRTCLHINDIQEIQMRNTVAFVGKLKLLSLISTSMSRSDCNHGRGDKGQRTGWVMLAFPVWVVLAVELLVPSSTLLSAGVREWAAPACSCWRLGPWPSQSSLRPLIQEQSN